jgi:hypothetical protein
MEGLGFGITMSFTCTDGLLYHKDPRVIRASRVPELRGFFFVMNEGYYYLVGCDTALPGRSLTTLGGT